MIDVERVRVDVERRVYESLDREYQPGTPRTVPKDLREARRRLDEGALRLSVSMAPDAYAAARTALAAFGLDEPVEIYVRAALRNDVGENACCVSGEPIVLEFIGGYLDRFAPDELVAIMGHEIGHAIAHYRVARYEWARAVSYRRTTRNRWACFLAGEFTADRFGLIACGDLDAVLRLQMRATAGSAASSLSLDTRAYLEHAREVAEGVYASGRLASGETHPVHTLRAYASWLFSETDVYAELTGHGPATRKIDDVDAIIGQLLGIGPDGKLFGAAAFDPTARDPRDETFVRLLPGLRAPGSNATGQVAELARRGVGAIAKGVGAVADDLGWLANTLRGRATPATTDDREDAPTTAPVPDDEERAWLARFEALEKRSKP